MLRSALKNQSLRAAARRRMHVESLERRSLLAGDVTAVLSLGSLVLTGDSDANHIVITADATNPGRVTLSAGDGATTINGSLGDVEFEFTNDLRVNLKAGDDILEIVGDGGAGSVAPRDLFVDLGDAPTQNEFQLTGGYTVTRNARISATSGFDLVNVDTLTAADLYFSLGNGGADVTINEVGTTKAITVLYGNSGGETNLLNGTGFTTGTGFTAQTGTGTNTVNISDALIGTTALLRLQGSANTVTTGSAGDVNVGNTFNVANSNGTNQINLLGLTVTGATFLRNGHGTNDVDLTDSSFNNALTLTNGNGTNTVDATGITVALAASLVGGAGDNATTLNGATFGKTLVITHGAGDGSVNLGATGLVSVASTTNIRQGHATTGNQVSVGDFLSFGALNIINGDNGATVAVGTVGHTLAVSGASVKNGNGNGAANFVAVDNATIDVDLTIVNGANSSLNTALVGVDASSSIGQHVTIRHGSGSPSFTTLNGAQVGGNLIIATGNGDDQIFLEDIGTGAFSIGGSTTIDTLAGEDSLLVGGNNAGNATFTGYFTARLGSDNDTVTVGEYALFTTPQNFLFDGGASTDTITVVNGTSFDPILPINRQRLKNFTFVLT